MNEGANILTEAAEQLAQATTKRLEYELLGAWRSGYNYLHIYEPSPGQVAHRPMGSIDVTQYVLPSNSKRRPDPTELRYVTTYDLTSTPDDVLLAASKGELDEVDHDD